LTGRSQGVVAAAEQGGKIPLLMSTHSNGAPQTCVIQRLITDGEHVRVIDR